MTGEPIEAKVTILIESDMGVKKIEIPRATHIETSGSYVGLNHNHINYHFNCVALQHDSPAITEETK